MSVYTSLNTVKSFIRIKNKTSVFMIHWATVMLFVYLVAEKKVHDALVSRHFGFCTLYQYFLAKDAHGGGGRS